MNNLYNNVYQPYASYMPRPYLSGKQIDWVLGIENAKSFPMRPGDSVVLLDSEQLRCYVKTCDNNGMCTLRPYAMTEIIDQPQQAAAAPIDVSNFVTKEELNKALEGLQTKAVKSLV